MKETKVTVAKAPVKPSTTTVAANRLVLGPTSAMTENMMLLAAMAMPPIIKPFKMPNRVLIKLPKMANIIVTHQPMSFE